MRLMLFFVLALFLVGCAPVQEFNVSLSSATHTDIFDSDQNKSLDVVSFLMTNNEQVQLECDILTSLDNRTNSTVKQGSVGILDPGESKNVSVKIEMFYGNTDLQIKPVCHQP